MAAQTTTPTIPNDAAHYNQSAVKAFVRRHGPSSIPELASLWKAEVLDMELQVAEGERARKGRNRAAEQAFRAYISGVKKCIGNLELVVAAMQAEESR